MSNTNTSKKAAQKAKRDENLNKVLGLATSTAQTELGDSDNRKVTAEASLSVTAVEGATTDKAGVTASVSLGVTSSSETAEAK